MNHIKGLRPLLALTMVSVIFFMVALQLSFPTLQTPFGEKPSLWVQVMFPSSIALIVLLLIVIIEGIILRFALKQKGYLLEVLRINLLTNPFVFMLLPMLHLRQLAGSLFDIPENAGMFADWTPEYSRDYACTQLVVSAALQMLVIIIEARLMRRTGIERPLRTSIILNSASYSLWWLWLLEIA